MAAFEEEFPGASWLSAHVMRELEMVGGLGEALIASVARRHGISHAALNALAVIEGNGTPMTAGAMWSSQVTGRDGLEPVSPGWRADASVPSGG